MTHWFKKIKTSKDHASKLNDSEIKDKVKAAVDLIMSANLDKDKGEIYDKVRSRMEAYFDIRKIQVTEHLEDLNKEISIIKSPSVIKDYDKKLYMDQLGQSYEDVNPIEIISE